MQTGAIEAVKQEKAVPEKGGRNYELDFFRLVFALLVFIYHTNPFIGKNTRVVLPPDLGAGAVHFFFILSGMFMANSIVKRGVTGNCAKLSIGFVLCGAVYWRHGEGSVFRRWHYGQTGKNVSRNILCVCFRCMVQ